MLLFSFVLPLYNLEQFIIPCLDSIFYSMLEQSNYEIIVWDDGSTDDSAKVVAEYTQSHGNIRLILRENHGVSWVRNQALLKAKGEYVWFVDSDDLVCSDYVPCLLDKALKRNLDMLLFNWKPISEDGSIQDFMLHPVPDGEVISGRRLYLSQQLCMAPWCYIYRRKFLLENALTFPEDFKTCEDIQFNQKALWYAKRVMTASKVGYYYRQMPSSATVGNAERLVKDHIRRITTEIDFFARLKDWEYLTKILYRNLREINVWLAKVERPEEYFENIKKTLGDKSFVIKPKFGVEYFMISLMKTCPNMLFYIQTLMKKARKSFLK